MGIATRAAGVASRRSRLRKVEWLREQIDPGSRVLFIGLSSGAYGGNNNMIEEAMSAHAITAGLVYDPPVGDPLAGRPVVRGDGRLLPFADDSFDYVVSNAVIEHVGGPDGAKLLIDESKRVARRATFHTTPDRRFPIETHTLMPILHWLPRRHQERAFATVGKRFPLDHYWLFSMRDLERLGHAHRLNRMTLAISWHAEKVDE